MKLVQVSFNYSFITLQTMVPSSLSISIIIIIIDFFLVVDIRLFVLWAAQSASCYLELPCYFNFHLIHLFWKLSLLTWLTWAMGFLFELSSSSLQGLANFTHSRLCLLLPCAAVPFPPGCPLVLWKKGFRFSMHTVGHCCFGNWL